jgi:hypothetical protein
LMPTQVKAMRESSLGRGRPAAVRT